MPRTLGSHQSRGNSKLAHALVKQVYDIKG